MKQVSQQDVGLSNVAFRPTLHKDGTLQEMHKKNFLFNKLTHLVDSVACETAECHCRRCGRCIDIVQ